jgi:hypothetical protein
MKYVMFKNKVGHLTPVIFPDCITHCQIVVEEMTAVSAGFVDPRSGKCFGHSQSLKLKAHRLDHFYVRAALTGSDAILTQIQCGLESGRRKSQGVAEQRST